MITILKETIGEKDGVAFKKIALEINCDQIKGKKAELGENIVKAIEEFESQNKNFFEEFMNPEGCLCWRDCNNIRGQSYTQKELTEKLLTARKKA